MDRQHAAGDDIADGRDGTVLLRKLADGVT